MSYHRIFCVSNAPEDLMWLQQICWARSGLFDWNFISFADAAAITTRPSCETLILHVRPGAETKLAIPVAERWQYGIFFDNSGTAKDPGMGWRILSGDELESHFRNLKVSHARPSVLWPNQYHPFVRTLHLRIPDSVLGLILEKYFPNSEGAAAIHPVSGGFSGVPLIRAVITDENRFEQYYIKLFDNERDFRDEWEHHPAAKAWMESAVVDIRAVPTLAADGVSQIVAFPRQGSGSFFPICFKAAAAGQTLKEHYRGAASTEFLAEAYRKVLAVLGLNQPPALPKAAFLMNVPVCGPFRSRPGTEATLLGEIRKDETLLQISTARDVNSRYIEHAVRTASPPDWHPFDAFLRGDDPAWITTPVNLIHGHVHGDANSRNFLIPLESALGPQIIDCGAHHFHAPRLFDLAQMESDLIVNLTAIERDAPCYGDIDPRLLLPWIRQQKHAIRALDGFEVERRLPRVLERAYTLLGVIRREAVILSSPHDPEGRAYFFFLLYWMVRKFYLLDKGLPHVKASIALNAAAEICSRFEGWKP